MDDSYESSVRALACQMQTFLDSAYIEPETLSARPAARPRPAKKRKLSRITIDDDNDHHQVEEDPLEFDFHAAVQNVKRPAAGTGLSCPRAWAVSHSIATLLTQRQRAV
jgi:hypothetical protein